jgi:hypothetical protein
MRLRSSSFRVAAAASFAATATLAPSVSAADSLHGTRGEIVEKTHAVDLTLSRGHVHMRVVREVHNRGERHDQAMYHLFLPQGAVATGLRTRGAIDGRPVWYEGELLEAELAARRYQELTGIGGYYPKDPALLSWRAQNHLALQVFPCPPKEDKGIGYDLDMPTRWVDGREQLELDTVGLDTSFGVATLHTDVPGAKIYVEGREVAAGTKIRLDGARTIELQPPNVFGGVDGRLASVAFGPDRSLVALRFDAPRQISQVPHGAHVVVALDTSRSLDAVEVAAEMRAASAYLAHFENKQAKVALVGYDRRARDLTPGFVPVPQARALLDGPAFPRANGSAIDEAVSRATALFAKAPTAAPKRVVVIGDLLARESLEPGKIKAPLGSIVHLATIGVGNAADVRRDDDDAWAALPRSTGGVLFHATAPSGPRRTWSDAASVEQAYLELARPVRIDRMVWRVPGVDPALGEGAGLLEEGASIEHRGIQAKLPANATIEGELWSKRYEKKIFASASEGKLWSALVFGTPMVHELSEPEMNVLARAGGAVSPVTSYLAIEPGVRPSTEGLDHGIGEGSGGRGEGIGLGNIGTIGKGAGSAPPDYKGIFASLMAGAVKKCGATGQTTIDVETTIAEVVDVAVKVSGDTRDRARATCVTEATWAVELPEVFRPQRLDLSVSL